MGHHTNKEIKKHIESSDELVQKLNGLTDKLQQSLFTDFKNNMGVPLPNAIEANVRVLQYDMVYAVDSTFEEYQNGARNLLQGIMSEDWSKVVLDALDVVANVVSAIKGSGTIQTGAHSSSAKRTYTNENNPLEEKTFVMACLAIVSECTQKQWLTEEDFYVSYYTLVVWSPTEEDMALIAI